MAMNDEQIDALPVHKFRNTPERLRLRHEWGMRAGRAAFIRGDKYEENPFTGSPVMPMREGWFTGWAFLAAEFGGAA